MRYSLLSNRVYFLFALGLVAFSCRTKDKVITPTPIVKSYAALTVNVSNEVSNQPVTLGHLIYTNASGNLYKVNTLKYYISNFTLIKDDNTESNFGNHKLLNAADPSTCKFTLDSVANGNYKAVRFYLGVDSAHNHTGLQEGDLDPAFGMIWTWRTGYIFFKHEGEFVNDTGGSSFIIYHYGNDDVRTTVDIPVSQFEIKGTDRTLYLKFDLNALYSTPNAVNFNHNNSHQSTEVGDSTWLKNLKANFTHSFSFDKVQ